MRGHSLRKVVENAKYVPFFKKVNTEKLEIIFTEAIMKAPIHDYHWGFPRAYDSDLHWGLTVYSAVWGIIGEH